VAAALSQLSPIYRDALLLHVWGELSYEQVAEATHVSVGTVRSRIHRARSYVRAALRPEEILK
jgi:RNA polymerase sigma factor (sigma-70 family)